MGFDRTLGHDLFGNRLFSFELGAKDLIISSSKVFFMGDPTMRGKNFWVKNNSVGSCVK
jgi:hypothetical protein